MGLYLRAVYLPGRVWLDGLVLKGCVPTRKGVTGWACTEGLCTYQEGVTGWACTEGMCTYQEGCDWMGLYWRAVYLPGRVWLDGLVLKGYVPTRKGVTGWACTEGLGHCQYHPLQCCLQTLNCFLVCHIRQVDSVHLRNKRYHDNTTTKPRITYPCT